MEKKEVWEDPEIFEIEEEAIQENVNGNNAYLCGPTTTGSACGGY